MALYYNGKAIENVTFNGKQLDKVYYNGTLIWENWIEKTGQLAKGNTGNQWNAPSTYTGYLSKPIRIIDVYCNGGSDQADNFESAGHLDVKIRNARTKQWKYIGRVTFRIFPNGGGGGEGIVSNSKEDKELYDAFSVTIDERNGQRHDCGGYISRWYEKGGNENPPTGWRTWTGNLVQMTSPNSPTPYTSDHYEVFGGGRLVGTEHFEQTISATLNFNSSQIRVHKFFVKFYRNEIRGAEWTFQSTVIINFKDGTSETLRDGSQTKGLFEGTLTVSEANQNKEVKSIYLKHYRSGGSGGWDAPVIANAKITEWEEKSVLNTNQLQTFSNDVEKDKKGKTVIKL